MQSLYDQFLETLEEVEVCSYCGNDSVCDVRGCCGESHTETAYVDEANELIRDDELDSAYAEWRKKQMRVS